MANLGKSFKAGVPGEFTGMQPLEEGWYPVEVSDAEVRTNSKGTGDVLRIVYNITSDDPNGGRKIYQNLNISNPSEKAEEIARAELEAIIAAAGLTDVRDSDDLLDAKLSILVRNEEYQGKIQHRVAGAKPFSGQKPRASTERQPPARQASPDVEEEIPF